MRPLLFLFALLATAGASTADISAAAYRADVVFLGEVHDNPAHHARQAVWISALQPAAIVFEMVAAETAKRLGTVGGRGEAALAQTLQWDGSGWPDFALYYPVFDAARDARLYGAAIPRDTARTAMAEGFAALWTAADIARFGLDRPLPAARQEQREAIQMRAHCDALPVSLLAGMVTVQRLRDAALARAALTALQETGGPVVVITGNGHARPDWGAPAALRLAAPWVSVFALGQSEDGIPLDADYDIVLDAPAPPRDDPCDAFR